MDITLLLFVLGHVGIALGQSVAQQCLTEQVRNNLAQETTTTTNNNNNNNNNNNRNNNNVVTPAALTMAAFDSICRNYEGYVNCFDTRLPTSNNPADRFLSLVFATESMDLAYTGLCTLDLEELRGNIQCLLSTPEVRRCYFNFNIGVNQMIGIINQRRLPLITLQQLACNVSVARYQCETQVYSFCNRRAGEIMQDFFFAGITDQCRQDTGVTSRYLTISGAPTGQLSLGGIIVMLVSLLFVSIMSLG